MLKILMAEDDRALCQLFSNVLMKNGYTVKGGSNGKEALDAIDNDYYDLVISDIMMSVIMDTSLCVSFVAVEIQLL